MCASKIPNKGKGWCHRRWTWKGGDLVLLCIRALWACMTTSSTPSVLHLTRPLPRLAHDTTLPMPSDSLQYNRWWTTSGGSTFLPTGSDPSSLTSSTISHLSSATPFPPSSSSSPVTVLSSALTSSTSPISASATSRSEYLTSTTLTTFTTSVPVTVSDTSTTFTFFSQTTVTSSRVVAFPDTATAQAAAAIHPICIGDGVDAGSLGLISTLLVPSIVGLLIWVSYVTRLD